MKGMTVAMRKSSGGIILEGMRGNAKKANLLVLCLGMGGRGANLRDIG